jgi:hypothetical protein
MQTMRTWCTSHLLLSAGVAAVATFIYLGVALIDSQVAEIVGVGYLVLIGTLALTIDWERHLRHREQHRESPR